VTRFSSLRWRLAAIYAGVLGVLLLAVLTAVSGVLEAALVRSTADRLTIEAGLIASDNGPGRSLPRATDLAAGDLAAVLGGTGTAVVIIDSNGATLAAQGNGAHEDVLDARLAAASYSGVVAEGSPVDEVIEAGSGRVLVVAVPIQLRESGPGIGGGPGNGSGNGNGNGNGNGRGNGIGRGLGNQDRAAAEPAEGPPNAVAQLAVSLDPIDATLTGLRLQIVALCVMLFAVAIVASWLLTRVGLRPLDRVALAADRIAAGDYSARAGLPDDGGEVGRLGRAFDGMAEQVDSALAAQRQFAADASHELRTPLTVLGGYVDVLERSDVDAAMRTRTLAAMRKEIDRLSRLSADLLFLAQVEAGEPRAAHRVDLGELLEDIGGAARAIGTEHTIEVQRDGPLPVVVDPDRLTQALMNLVDNAVRHSPAGGTVRLAASRGDGMAVAEVSNTGDPIPEADLPRVFDRFYQGTNGSGRTPGHAGLGLAITRAIAVAAGGSVTAASDAEWTRFSIRLPLADPSSS
jgi:two-component system OmpR family sensor kinase